MSNSLGAQRHQRRWDSTQETARSPLPELNEEVAHSSTQCPRSDGAVEMLKDIQELCLSPLLSDSERAQRWQCCIQRFLASSLSVGSSATESNLVDLLESLRPAASQRSQGLSALPGTGRDCEGPVHENESRTLTQRETQRLFDWIFYACITFDAPVPLVSAVYQARRSLSRRERVGRWAGDERSGDGDRVLAVTIPWKGKGIHACYARYLLQKYEQSRMTATPDAKAVNGEILALFESLFRSLLLESAEDVTTTSDLPEAATAVTGRSVRPRAARTLATSAALQLALLKGMYDFLSYLRSTGVDGRSGNHLNSSFPVLAWLLEREGTTDLLTNAREVARCCLAKLERADAGQQGLATYWAVFLELYLREMHTLQEREGTRGRIVATKDFLRLNEDCFLAITSHSHFPSLAADAATSDAASAAQKGNASSTPPATEETLGQRGAVSSVTPQLPLLERWIGDTFEEVSSQAVESRTEASLRVSEALYQKAKAFAQEGAKNEENDGGSGKRRPSLTFLAFFADFLESLKEEGGGHTRDGSVSLSPYIARAFLLPCITFHGENSSGKAVELSLPFATWFLSSALDDVRKSRQIGEAEWSEATGRCVALLKVVCLSFDQSLSYFGKRKTKEGAHKANAAHRRQLRVLNQSLQVCWLSILSAVNEGLFCSASSTQGAVSPDGARVTTAEAERGKNRSHNDRHPTCPVLSSVLLPFYHAEHWQRDTVNEFVEALHAWALSHSLRRLFQTIQRREAFFQARVWHTLRARKGEGDDDGDRFAVLNEEGEEEGSSGGSLQRHRHPQAPMANSGTAKRQPAYHPVLTLHACDIILAHCLEHLRDPVTAAAVVKYMLISLRASSVITDDVAEEEIDGASAPQDQPTKVAEDEHEAHLLSDSSGKQMSDEMWLHKVTLKHIPAVNSLFVETGINNDGSWMEM